MASLSFVFPTIETQQRFVRTLTDDRMSVQVEPDGVVFVVVVSDWEIEHVWDVFVFSTNPGSFVSVNNSCMGFWPNDESDFGFDYSRDEVFGD